MNLEKTRPVRNRFVDVGDLVAANYCVDTLDRPKEGLGIVVEVYSSSVNWSFCFFNFFLSFKQKNWCIILL